MSTERRNPHPEDAEDTLGVLDSAGAIDTAGIGLLGDATAQVAVELPTPDEDDLVDDDDVIGGESYTDLVLDADALVLEADGIGRIHDGADIVIEIPAVPVEVVVAEIVDDEDASEEDSADDEAQDALATAVADASAFEDASAFAEAEPASAEPEDVAPVDAVEDLDAADDAPEDGAGEAEPDGEDAIDEHEPDESVLAPFEPAAAVAPSWHPWLVEAEAEAEAAAAAAEPAAPVFAPMPVRPAPPVPMPVVAEPVTEEEIVTPEPAHVPESELAPRRLDQFGDRERESADLLTADRLLDPHQLAKPEPEGLWSHLLYTVSGRRINIGDGKRAKERKALNARIAAPLTGSARFVPVLSRKGGVGKTTVTALLGMALADAREDRVIAVDANPDRGTLADRISRTTGKTVRDLVRIHDQVSGYHDISAVVSRDGTRLDVLASDADPHISEAFNDVDYEQVASVAAHYYSLVLTDTGTGIVHSVMGATLDRADTIVIVAGLSVDEARLASETLTWLEANGHADKVRRAVVVLNQSTPGSPLVRLDELEAHFRTRVAHVLRIPYDPQIAAGSAIAFPALQPETRRAARELAAIVVEGLRAQAA
ncbi:AAA family ATPase [Microbacterium capsulatum]|uniref:AAA family ATPase n=1 Tax=Microbacterium capsulatum TaxID=3041921 RepID=A0ABU0XCU7_9MICO|nr:AAA family ATPase [Microbacterium sp. ASV81]MDQ4212935.1 AAA family ATPase [Microbacterium sp. ASV81]